MISERCQAAWLDAMRTADIDRLLLMVTDDIVAAASRRQDDARQAGIGG